MIPVGQILISLGLGLLSFGAIFRGGWAILLGIGILFIAALIPIVRFLTSRPTH